MSRKASKRASLRSIATIRSALDARSMQPCAKVEAAIDVFAEQIKTEPVNLMQIKIDVPDDLDCLKCGHYEDRLSDDGKYREVLCMVFRETIYEGSPCGICRLRRNMAIREENA